MTSSSTKKDSNANLRDITPKLIGQLPQDVPNEEIQLFDILTDKLSHLSKEEKNNLYGRTHDPLAQDKDIVFLINIKGEIQYANHYSYVMTEEKDIIGQNVFERHKPAIDLPKKLVLSSFKTGLVTAWENPFRKINYSHLVVPYCEKDGKIKYSYLISKDISDKHDYERDLREKDLLLSTALQTNKSHIFSIDMIHNQLVRYNYNEKFYGMEHVKHIEDLSEVGQHFHPDDLPNILRVMDDNVKGLTERFYHESRVRQIDGSYRWHSFSGKIVEYIDDTPVKTIGLATDIHEQKIAEESRRALESQLYHTQKMEAIGRMAGSISHDFNNLLTAIIGQAELSLMSLDEDSPLNDDLNTILEAAQRAGILARQILSISRKQKSNPKIININDSITNLNPLLDRISGKDITLELDLEPGLKETKIDPSQVDQILVNLVINARDAIDEKGKIFISTKCTSSSESNIADELQTKEGEFILLSVSDTGNGIPKSILNNIFEPFFTTKPEGKGTGLGLATIHGIVRQNHGTIHVYSEKGNGTTFKIYLPVVHQKTVTVSDKELTAELPTGTETILIVEDEDGIRTLAMTTLAKYGYRVLDASSAKEATEILRREINQPHLILTDVFLPEINGPNFIKNIKSEIGDSKIIFMSGYTSEFVREKHSDLKKISFLAKPFRPHELLTLVRKVLDE